MSSSALESMTDEQVVEMFRRMTREYAEETMRMWGSFGKRVRANEPWAFAGSKVVVPLRYER